ncbi:MFS transporter [Streptantibioticus rubrisoli]|uniref:MFS transporter n=1 Tax=Streptantibioticus rubrisoli TaxID=1387313 RepID=UPI00210A4784|nr:MFS transporter [Streptantibioticus rubrisoli]
MAIFDREVRTLLTENRAFRNIWLGEISAHFGGQVTSFLLPLIAVTYLHVDGTGVGLVSAVQFVPIVVLSLIAGVMVDRYPPRRALVAASVAQGAALALLGVFQAAKGLTFGQLIVAAVVIGVATVFYEVAYQSTLPRILPVDSIAAANGLHQATYSISTLAGPSAAGFLIGRLGLSPTLTVAAACSAGAAVSGMLLRGVKAPEQPRQSAVRAIGSGLRYTWSLRPIRDLCVQAGLSNLHEKAFLTVFLVFAIRALGMSGTTVGLITGVGSVGALIGSLCANRLAKRWTVGGTVALGAVLAAGGLLLIPVVAHFGAYVAVLASIAMVLNGFGVALFNVFAVSLRQAIPPEHQLGAVTASYRLVALGTLPLGAFIGGALSDALSPGNALWLVGLSYLVVSFWLTWSPLRRARTLEEAEELGRTTGGEAPPVCRSPSA